MSIRTKILIALLSIVVVVTGFLPQMAQAHRYGETVAQVGEMLASTSQRNNGIDIDALIAASPECDKEGLLLLINKNTWTAHPQNHDEMVQCLNESIRSRLR